MVKWYERGGKMTRKQQLFCEYYIETLNATQSAKKAGYSEKTAYRCGYENLKKPQVKAYIDEYMASKDNKIIASQDEILSYLTSVVRGEELETRPVVKNIGDFCQEIVNQEFQVTPKDRIKAAELLGKRYRLWDKDNDSNKPISVQIINDIPKPKDI
jgi:phage terminase small subunit